ncbi:hypothetical protein RHSIM_Rhsim03G0180300 [Rhododendron simsii]|uniref:Uncharacterized protein n=1 Tax=Rhododendron simsii TaxID=118357 RepID=A0A834LPB7_RHOSS|nr:hypothetical protein RHSIM_Rhsim03G0180300 [Rhododendron simsii]
MAIIHGLTEVCAGLAHPKQPYQIQKYSRCTPSNYCGVQLVSRRIPRAKTCLATHFRIRYVAPALRSHHGLSYDDEDFVEEPIWLTLKKEAFGALKSLFIFLLEQPSQLKYIEWPSFQSTLKTASLTLILMALLIVALASVDSALCYLLALFLRKSP